MKLPSQPGIRKYVLGLGLLMLFTLGLLIFVILQANGVKQDTVTFKAADSAATKLNNYIDSNNAIPSSLSKAGVKTTPAAVTYTKLSATKYRFCVNYKRDSTNFSAASVESSLLTAQTPASGGFSSSPFYPPNSVDTLYLDPSHHAGNNCQTITPYLYDTGGGCVYPLNGTTGTAYDDYIACLDQTNQSYTPTSSTPYLSN